MIARRRSVGGIVVVAVLAGVVSGCEQNDPTKPLTVDQQARLLKDIRSNPKRTQDLTPAEKQYLLQRMGH